MSITIKPINTLSAFNAEAWEWLNENAPDIAQGVQADVAAGCKPDAIYWQVLDLVGTHRRPVAVRCRLAAEFLSNGGES